MNLKKLNDDIGKSTLAALCGVLKKGERIHVTYKPIGQSVQIIHAKTEKHTATNLSPARSNGA